MCCRSFWSPTMPGLNKRNPGSNGLTMLSRTRTMQHGSLKSQHLLYVGMTNEVQRQKHYPCIQMSVSPSQSECRPQQLRSCCAYFYSAPPCRKLRFPASSNECYSYSIAARHNYIIWTIPAYYARAVSAPIVAHGQSNIWTIPVYYARAVSAPIVAHGQSNIYIDYTSILCHRAVSAPIVAH